MAGLEPGTILITGTDRGIGLEAARQYAEAGWRVVACAHHPETALQLKNAAESTDSGRRLRIVGLDVTDSSAIQALARELEGQPIDLLLNNAGLYGPKQLTFGFLDAEEWIRVFRVNTLAPLLMAQAFTTHVAQSRRKIIAVISSLMGSLGNNISGGHYIYRTTKAGANMVVRSLAVDLRPLGIIVVALNPGWVRTDIGGPHALLSTQDSVLGLRQVLERITPQKSGLFLDHDGEMLPW